MDNLAATNLIVRVFVATGFIYFVTATVLLALNLNGIIAVENDPIFILALYGFVAQLIFGVSYIFVPGVSHTKFASYKSAVVEYVLLNIGLIVLVSSMLLTGYRSLAVIGAAALILSVLIHAANIWSITMPKKTSHS